MTAGTTGTGNADDRRFSTTALARPRGGIAIELPFDPDEVWATRPRHDVTGTIGGYGVRGQLARGSGNWRLELGPAWCRDPRVGAGREVDVVLRPEPPQLETVASDIREAIAADSAAQQTFGSIATFYRKGFVEWIEAARRPDTRARRIGETVSALREGRRER